MHAESSLRLSLQSTFIFLALVLSGCGTGDGPERIAGSPATPLPPIPPGFCDAINFEILCPPPSILNFNGGQTSIIDNPDMSGLNTSDKVAQMQKFPDDPALLFGGTRLDLAAPVDFSAGEAFKVKVWSPRSVRMIFKLEEANNPNGGSGLELSHTGSGTWEELCYDFTGLTGSLPPIPAFTVIFDNGVAGAADTNPGNWTFYYDDIEQVESCGDGGGDGGGGGGGDTTTLPVSFENDAASYDFGVDGGFEGGAASVIANPQSNGINTSAQVGQMLKFNGAVYGGSTLAIDTATLAAGSSFTMKVWSQRAVPVQFQLEPYADPFFTSVVMHNGSGWEELTFEFPTFAGDVSGITLIFDPTVSGDAETDALNWTFYFDDIALVPPPGGGGGGGGGVGDIAVNGGFESGDFTGWELFPGGGLQAITDVNPSSGTYAANLTVPVRGAGDPAVDNIIKNANLEAGNLTAGGDVTVSFDMRGSLSGDGGVVFVELFSELSGGGTSKAEILSGGPLAPNAAWTSYSFTTTLGDDVSGGVTLQLKASCGQVEGCGVDIFIDNVTIVTDGGGTGGGGDPVAAALPVDFEGVASSYDFGVDGGFEGGAASVIANPQSNGINTSAQVGQMLKFDGAVFGGSTLAIDTTTLAAGSSFTMKVWSQRAVAVLFQLEPFNDPFFVAEVTHTGSGWEELTFSFPTFSGDVSGITLIFDNGTAGAAATDATNWTFYFDDITLVPPSGGGGGTVGNIAVNGGFETGDLTGWEALPGGGTQTVSTDNPASGTYSVNLVVPVRGPDDPPVDNLLKNANLEAGNLTPGGTITVSFDMRGSLSGVGGVVFAELFSELSGGGTSKSEILGGGPLSPTTNWTSYSFTTTLGDDVSGGVTLQLKASCGPVEGCGVDIFIDNVTITTGDGDGGGGTGGGYAAISFDDAGTTYTLTGFDGAEGSFVTNDPAGGTNMVVQVDRSATAAAAAGTIVSTGANFSIPALPLDAQNTQMTVRVYSPAAGIPVRLKIEDSNDTNVSVETETLTTVAGAWETLKFNFLDGTDGSAGSSALNIGRKMDRLDQWFDYTSGLPLTDFTTWTVETVDGPMGALGFQHVSNTDNASSFLSERINIDVTKKHRVRYWANQVSGDRASLPFIQFFDINDSIIGIATSDAINWPLIGSVSHNLINPKDVLSTPVNTWDQFTFEFGGDAAPTIPTGTVGMRLAGSFVYTGTNTTTIHIQDYHVVELPGDGTTPFDPAATYDKVTIYFNFGTDGASAGAQTFYFDDIDVLAGTGGGGAGVELVVNGDFETGDLADWDAGGTGGVVGIETPGSTGSFAANVNASGGPFIGTFRQANLGIGQLTPGQEVTVSFDWKGTAGIGGITRISVISEPGGAGTAQVESIIDTGAFPADWTTVGPTTFNLGPEVGGGVTFEVFVECGAEASCVADVSLDNISIIAALSDTGGGGGGGPGPIGDAPGSCGAAGELSTNCDFETGDLTGWTVFDNGGLVEVVATGGSTSQFAAHLVAGAGQSPLIQQFELLPGVVMPGDTFTISFDMKGSLSGDGGVVFGEFISEGIVNTNAFLDGGPIFPTPDWATYTFTPVAGADVSRGISFQLVAVCGANIGCGVDVYFDNVSIILN